VYVTSVDFSQLGRALSDILPSRLFVGCKASCFKHNNCTYITLHSQKLCGLSFSWLHK